MQVNQSRWSCLGNELVHVESQLCCHGVTCGGAHLRIAIDQSVLDSFALAVQQKCPEAIRDVVVGDKLQVELVELERIRVLYETLVHRVQELQKDGRKARLVVDGVVVAASEAVAHGEPLALDKHRKALDGAVVRVHEELGERGDLCG